MHSATFVAFAVQLAMMLACGLVGGALARKLRQPAVVGEMLGGIVLGPTLFGAISPEMQQYLLPAEGASATLRNGVVKLGMLFFMFTVGLEINPRGIRQHGWTAVLIGLIGTLVPLAAGVATVFALPDLFPADPELRFPLALFIGASLANSANPVLARILLDLGLLKDRLGAIILSATVVDDLVAWSMLFFIFQKMAALTDDPLAAADAPTLGIGLVGVAVLFAGTLVLGVLVSRWLSRRRQTKPERIDGRIGVIGICVLAAAAAAEWLEVHAFLGPFLFGIALAPRDEDTHDDAYESLRRFTQGIFVPIYFVSLGLTTDFVAHFSLPLVTVVLFVATVTKIPAAYAGARLGGLDTATSWAIGCGMNARGATGIILAGVGRDYGVIDRPTYVALVVMAIVTSLAAGPLMQACLSGRRLPATERATA